MKRIALASLAILALILCSSCSSTQEQTTAPKPRTIVTTDGEVDDMDSFVRFLLYTNEMDVAAIVYSSSEWHWAGDGKGTLFTSEMQGDRVGERVSFRWLGTTWIQEMIDKYAEAYPNLIKHADGYPTPDYLKSIVKVGNIIYEGDMDNPTEGSDYIKDILLDDDPRPVYVEIWGGTNTLARALLSIEEQYKDTPDWDNIYKKVSDKCVIYAILDQDMTYQKYVKPNWPDVKIIYNSSQFWSFAYMWVRAVPDELRVTMEGPWYKENIKFDHGSLMSSYMTWGDGHQLSDPDDRYGSLETTLSEGRQQYDFISEGDSPSYFMLMDFGLRSLEDFSWGGVGGRFVPSETIPNRWEDSRELTDYNPYTDSQDATYPQTRWAAILQNDFAARADWCVATDYASANHRPVASVTSGLDVTASAGSQVTIKATASDPDDNALTYSWWQYKEAGTCASDATIEGADSLKPTVTVPTDAKAGDTIHVILQVKDNGTPELSYFQRVVITVK